MSVALHLFESLRLVGHALEVLRDAYPVMSDQWVWHTEVLGLLDASIDDLVHSEGLEADDG